MADLASGYNIIEKIGVGARSTIYRVVDPRSGETYALKRVIREPHEDARFLEQAINEHEIAQANDHPSLRRSYELKRFRKWTKLSEVQVVMEYVQGVSLEQHRPTDVLEIVEIFLKVAEGIDALHRAGFLHADLKPNNILAGVNGEVKIIDFGQGCPIGFRKKRIQGTPGYIAPEQAHRRPLDQRTDFFNLGATLYWALTGREFPTIISKNAKPGVINVVAPRSVPSPVELNEETPVALSRLVMECCQERPQDRPRDIRQIISRLEATHNMLSKQREAESKDKKEGAPDAAADAKTATSAGRKTSKDESPHDLIDLDTLGHSGTVHDSVDIAEILNEPAPDDTDASESHNPLHKGES
ncbi:MAG: serine/threonine-protein kinase [Phycisphaerae bacterium]